MTAPRPADHGWWLASRSAGLVALVLITLSVALGLLMAGRVLRRPGVGRILGAVHEQLALAGLIAIAVHMLTLLGDPFLRPGARGILVPFAMSHRPAYTGLGIVAAYLGALLGLSFYARRRIGPLLWRRLHRLTVVVYLLAVVHTLGAGTDAGAMWLRAGLLGSAAPIVFLLCARLLGPGPRPARRAVRPEQAR